MHKSSGATIAQELVARVTRLYPLYSGCGTMASHPFFQRLSGNRQHHVWARTSFGSIKVPLTDYVGRALFFFGDLDPKITWIIKRLVLPGQTVADIGANVGIVTLQLSKLVGAEGRVHAFEPNPYLANLLQETLRRNTVLNTSVHEIGLGAMAGEMELFVPSDNQGMGSLIQSSPDEKIQKYRVPVSTLDQVSNQQFDRLDFIKIDVEGFEQQVLEGGQSALRRFRPIVLLEENQPRNKGDLPGSLLFLLKRRYRLVGIPKNLFQMRLYLISDSKVSGDSSHDFLAIPEEQINALAPRLNIFP